MAPGTALRDANVYLSRWGPDGRLGRVGRSSSDRSLCASFVRCAQYSTYSTPQAVRLALFRTRARSVQLPTVS